MLPLLLNYWKQIISVIFVAFIFGTGYYNGYNHEKSVFETYKKDTEKRQEEVSSRQSAITADVAYSFRQDSQKTKEVLRTVTKEIPKYVYIYDKDCTIPNSFVSMWDAINGLQIPSASEGFDGTPSGVKLSQVLSAKADDTDKFYQCYNQLKSLQKWVSKEGEIE